MIPSIRPPRTYRRLIERACARDAEFFAKHPNEATRIRPYCPGEWWPLHHTTATHVRVERLPHGCRARQLGVLGDSDSDGDFYAVDDLVVVDDSDERAALALEGSAPLQGMLPGAELLGMVDCREGGGR